MQGSFDFFSAFHSLLFPFAFLDLITFLTLWNLWQHMTIKSHYRQPSWWDTNLLFGMKSIISDQHYAGILGWSNSGRSRRRPDLPTSACCKWHLSKCFWLTTIDCRHQKKSLRRENTVPLRWRTRTWPKQQRIRLPGSIQIPHQTTTITNWMKNWLILHCPWF